MTDEDLLALDYMGFIPGTSEEEPVFLKRVEASQKKYQLGGWLPESHWNWVRELLDQRFHVRPLYICAFYSSRGLAPWQAAASWMKGKSLDRIQLKKRFQKGKFLYFSREEILAHEAVHGVRCAFDEDLSEEFFAFMSSEKSWRRVLGPIVRRPWHVWPLFLCLLGPFFPAIYWMLSFWIALGFYQLIRQHRRLQKAAEEIQKRTKSDRMTRAVLFRLTDQEIERFSKKECIDSYAKDQSCLRWRVIRCYLYTNLNVLKP